MATYTVLHNVRKFSMWKHALLGGSGGMPLPPPPPIHPEKLWELGPLVSSVKKMAKHMFKEFRSKQGFEHLTKPEVMIVSRDSHSLLH